MAETKKESIKVFDSFVMNYQLEYIKAAECLLEDKNELLTFFDYPAEHWVYLRTTDPIEYTFAGVRHGTKKSKNCFSRTIIIASLFRLLMEVEKRWRLLNGKNRIAQVINLDKFINGIHEKEINKQQSLNQKQAA